MIDEINLALKPLMIAMRRAQRACEALDETILDAERLREEERSRLKERSNARRSFVKLKKNNA